MTMVPRLARRQAADFDEFQPERLDLGQHAVKRGLVGQHADQRGVAAVCPGVEGGERGADRLAQPAADTNLVPLRPRLALPARHGQPAREFAARAPVGAAQVTSLMTTLLSFWSRLRAWLQTG